MSNKEQLFAEIIPTEEANLSGGYGGYYSYDNLAASTSNASAVGGRFNFAITDNQAYTTPYSAHASGLAVAQTSS